MQAVQTLASPPYLETYRFSRFHGTSELRLCGPIQWALTISHPFLTTWSQATSSANLSYHVVVEMSVIVSCSKYGISKTLFIIYLQEHRVSKNLSFIAFPRPDGRPYWIALRSSVSSNRTFTAHSSNPSLPRTLN